MNKAVVIISSIVFCSIFIISCEEKEDPPVASFNCDKTSGPIPLKVDFTFTSQGKISSYVWDFGDGGTSTTQNPQHTYVNAGTYTAKLTVTGPGGSNSSTKTITATQLPPSCSFTSDKASGAIPLTVNFTSTSSGTITSYSWNFGDGSSSTSQNPSHTYNTNGSYTVTLTVNGPGGSDSDSKTISVTPKASFTFSPATGTAPVSIGFTSTSTGTVTSYSWNFGDGGTSTSQNPTHTYTTGGTFTITLTVNGPGGSNSATSSITIGANPGTTLIFYNKSYTTITITVGSTTKTISKGSSVTYSGVQGSSVYYSAYTYGKTSDGTTQIGQKITWASTLSLSGGTQSWNLNVSSDYFFIYLKNNSSHDWKWLYVNYGLVSQTLDNIIVYKNSTTYDPLGYYRAFSNSNVRMYWADNTLYYTYWNQGTHFTLPWTVNQSTYLSYAKSDNIGTDKKSDSLQMDEPGTSIVPLKPYIYKTDPNAKDLFSK